MKSSNIAAAVVAAAGLTASSAMAATIINPIEFKEDDQAGFDLWPSEFAGSVSTAEFVTPLTTSGMTTVTITASTTLGQALNRGSISDGTPPGFSYENLYRDLLIASSPTGFLTIDVDGLDANQTYQFTLFAWDPGDSVDRDRQWTVTGGTGVPTSNTLNWGTMALVDNNTFAMNFDITTDAGGAFQLTDTGALQGSAINGFILEQIPEPSAAVLAALAAIGLLARRRR